MNDFFRLRGVVEGFYGVFYTSAERQNLIRFISQHGYNFYLYAPKNDRHHREQWREPYPALSMKRFKETITVAQECGVRFCYALSPGLSISYSSEADFNIVTAKFRAFYDLGVRAFSLLLDDIVPDFVHKADRAVYRSYAEAHVDICNRVYRWLQDLDPATTLSMCPTDYHGEPPFGSYLETLGSELDPAIDIFYTGPQVCSKTITTFDAAAFAQAVRRSPLIWDNYPVNDGEMAAEMHLGPIQGRDSTLYHAARGILVNPMTQVEASRIALATYGRYMANPLRYDAQGAWECALLESVGPGSFNALGTFAENSMTSCLDAPEAVTLDEMVEVTVLMLQNGCEPSCCPVVEDLEAYLDHMDDACYHLLNEMDNVALRNELIPWIELLQLWIRMARRAIQVLRAMEMGESYEQPLQQMNTLLDDIQNHPKRIAGRSLLLLSAYTLEKVSQQIGAVDFSLS